ncbi:MAG: hypothetical protein ACRCYU_09285 [Nocardioides sp.]
MKEQITLTYCGRRIGGRNKLVYEYDLAGRSMRYAKLTHGVVGGRYTVDAELSEDGGVTIYPATLRYAGEKADDDLDRVAVWESLDRDAWNNSRLLAAERKHAKSSELDAALEDLIRIVQHAATRSEVQAILRVVTEKVDRAWWERP